MNPESDSDCGYRFQSPPSEGWQVVSKGVTKGEFEVRDTRTIRRGIDHVSMSRSHNYMVYMRAVDGTGLVQEKYWMRPKVVYVPGREPQYVQVTEVAFGVTRDLEIHIHSDR